MSLFHYFFRVEDIADPVNLYQHFQEAADDHDDDNDDNDDNDDDEEAIAFIIGEPYFNVMVEDEEEEEDKVYTFYDIIVTVLKMLKLDFPIII
jgi:hypothetical protein